MAQQATNHARRQYVVHSLVAHSLVAVVAFIDIQRQRPVPQTESGTSHGSTATWIQLLLVDERPYLSTKVPIDFRTRGGVRVQARAG